MKRGYSILLLTLLNFTGCESPTNVNINPGGKIPLDTKTQIENYIVIDQSDYNAIHIQSGDSLWLSTNEINKIILGYMSGDNFIAKDTVQPVYEDHQLYYTLKFSGGFTVPDTTLYLELALKLLSKTDPLVISRNILMIRYPYSSATLFFKFSYISLPYTDMTDFVIKYPLLYFFDFGGGIYEYNFETKETRQLIGYLFGYFLDNRNRYLFIDNNTFIKRYNLNLETLDSTTPDLRNVLNSTETFLIKGLTMGDSTIYLLTANPYYISEFTFDLKYLNKKSFNAVNPYSLFYYKGRFYTQLNVNDKVAVFDSQTLQLLGEHPSPTQYFREFKIYDDTIYVSDRLKRCIFRVPLADFLSK